MQTDIESNRNLSLPVRELIAAINEDVFDHRLSVGALKARCRIRDNNISSRFKYEIGISIKDYPRRLLSFVLMAASPHLSFPQQISAPANIQSPSASVRAKAFYALIATVSKGQPHRNDWRGPRTDLLAARARSQDDLAVSLIDLLTKENAIVTTARTQRTPIPKDFDVEGYYGDLSSTVAELQDKRAINALVGAMSGNGPIENAVASFGGTAVPAVVGALESPDQYQRWSAVLVLRTVTSGTSRVHLDANTTAVITRALLGVISDPKSPLAREAAIQALIPLPANDDVRATMERVAATDTLRGYSPKTASRYPAREAARSWLTAHP